MKEVKKLGRSGGIEIKGREFVKDLKKVSKKSNETLSSEVYRDRHLMGNIQSRNRIPSKILDYFCDTYNINKMDYLVQKTNKAEKVVNTLVAATSTSELDAKTVDNLNATLVEMNETLKQMKGTLSLMSGYLVNINVNTYEEKEALRKLSKYLE